VKAGEIEKEMLGLARKGSLPAEPAAWVDQIDRIERSTAIVALVTARVGIPAIRAGTFHVPIGQEPSIVLTVELDLRLCEDVSLLVQGAENILCDTEMIHSMRVGEEIEGDPQLLIGLQKAPVVPPEDIFWCHAFALSGHRDRRPVRVASAHHENAVAAQTVIAGEGIGGNIDAGDMAEMEITVGVGPGDEDADRFWHRSLLLPLCRPVRFAFRLKQIADVR
jgi:hypothetical protein